MRYCLIAFVLAVAGCTEPNPLYDPLSAYLDEHPGTPDPRVDLAQPDMSIAPDLAPPIDLLPPPDFTRPDGQCVGEGQPCGDIYDCCLSASEPLACKQHICRFS